MAELRSALLVDLAAVLAAVLILSRVRSIRFSHPATAFIVLHLLLVTARLAALLAGAPFLFEDWGYSFQSMTAPEISWAARLADAGLLAAAIAAVYEDRTKVSRSGLPRWTRRNASAAGMSVGIALAAAGGIAAVATIGLLPGKVTADSGLRTIDGVWDLSPMMSWLGVLAVLLFFRSGASPLAVAVLSANSILMAYQGYHRFRVALPLVAALLIWLDRRGRRWPTPMIWAAIVAGAFVFLPLKNLGVALQGRASAGELWGVVQGSGQQTISGLHPDTALLDQMAAAVSQADERGTYLYGRSYLSMLTLVVPRSIWAEKPGLGDHIVELSTRPRPIGEMGAVIFLFGESYLNFGVAGVAIIPGILVFALARLSRAAYSGGRLSRIRLLYYLAVVCIVQVWRDGISSFVTFGIIAFLPALVAVAMPALRARGRRAPDRETCSTAVMRQEGGVQSLSRARDQRRPGTWMAGVP